MKYRKLKEARREAQRADVDFEYVCCLLDSLQAVRRNIHEGNINERDKKDLEKIEKSLINILDYVGVRFVISDWDAVKSGEY